MFRLGKHEVGTRAYVGAFNFKGSDQQKKVGQLSGGERNRVHMAKMLQKGGNVLLLDEPTNDLDVETLRALEEALEQRQRFGAVLRTLGERDLNAGLFDELVRHGLFQFAGGADAVAVIGDLLSRRQRLGGGQDIGRHRWCDRARHRRRRCCR